jgi:hypothetical protein
VYDTPRTIEQILTMLADGPARITTLTAGLTPAQLCTPPEPGEWSANDVLAHLRACADVWGNYMAVIIAEDMPTIRAVNPTTWIKKTDYPEQEFWPSLQAFAAQRADLLALLEPLGPEVWSRAATMTGSGKPRIRTAHTYGEWLVNHERSHFKQFARIVDALRV